jgi:hypothetical protein
LINLKFYLPSPEYSAAIRFEQFELKLAAAELVDKSRCGKIHGVRQKECCESEGDRLCKGKRAMYYGSS